MGVAALVLGIIGLLLSLIPLLGIYAAPLTVLAVILGIVGIRKPQGRGMAIAGLVCGVLGCIVVALWLLLFGRASSEITKALDNSKRDIAKLGADRIANDWYPRWAVKSPEKQCPDSLQELAIEAGASPSDLTDPWGSPYKFLCGHNMPPSVRGGIGVYSTGEDKRDGTPDDIRSWEPLR